MYAHHPQPAHVPRQITILGETDFRHRHHRFGMLAPDRLRHLWILGKTGSGKSTLLAYLLAQDLAQGQGLALLDPHGELVGQAQALLPPARTNEVLLFAPADHEFPISFNVFRAGRRPHADPGLLASSLVTVFKKHWAAFWGPRLEHVLRMAILAIAKDPRATLLFLYRFLTDENVRDGVVENVNDPLVRTFWAKEFPSWSAGLKAEALSPVLNKLGAFVAQTRVRNIVGAERSRIDLAALMQHRGILLADLSMGAVGADASHLLGGLLLSSLELAARALPPDPTRPPFLVYVDEFQNFVTESLASMLAESRKFGLGLVLAHQYLGQLPDGIVAALLGNIGSIVLFRLGAEDAAVLAPEFDPPFTATDLANLGRYQIAVKLLVEGTALTPFNARTLSQPPVAADAVPRLEAIKRASRLRFAQPRVRVEAWIKSTLGV